MIAGAQRASALAAILWAVHPLRVEVVAWASCQPYLPCSTFLLSSTLAYLHANHQGAVTQRTWRLVSLGLFVMAGLSKGLAMMFPLVLMILDVVPLRRFDVRRPFRQPNLGILIEKLPFWVVSLAIAAAALWARARSPGRVIGGLAEYMMQPAYGLVYYVLKTLWPVGLTTLQLRIGAVRAL